jgi:hypothetical protein
VFDWPVSLELILRSSSHLHQLLIGISPSVEAGSADAKIPTGFAGIADLLGVLKHPKFALNIALLVRHENFLRPKTGNLLEVSRESVHIYTVHVHSVLRAVLSLVQTSASQIWIK